MNPLTLGMDALLAALLIAAVVTGVRLSGRLKALREGQAGFATAVADLDAAAQKADRALKSLHAACESAHDDLLARIETARALSLKLEKATDAAGKAAGRAEEAAGRGLTAYPSPSFTPPPPAFATAAPSFAPPSFAPPPSFTASPPTAPQPAYASHPTVAPRTPPGPPATAPARRSLSELLAAREPRSPLRDAAPAPAPVAVEPPSSPRRRLTADEDLFGDDVDERPVRGRLGSLSAARGR